MGTKQQLKNIMNLMEVKKGQPRVDETKASSARQASEFVGEVKEEIKRIEWTSPDELKTYTKIVVGATFVLGLSIFAIDLVIRSFLNSLGSFVHWITG